LHVFEGAFGFYWGFFKGVQRRGASASHESRARLRLELPTDRPKMPPVDCPPIARK
jgi:hypothetical protein